MKNIFDCRHIFIVFQQGAGGNFVSSLIKHIVNDDLDAITVTDSGSAHPEVDLKVQGRDYLSFGTLPDDQLKFKSAEERETYYIQNIQKEYANCAINQIVWTHDFSNIPLYQKYFPNSKILVITQETVKEKIALTCMNVLKTILAPGSPGPFPVEQWQNIKNRWMFLYHQELQNFLDIDITQRISNIIKEQFPDIFKYINIIKRLEYFRLRHYIDKNYEITEDVVNNSLFNVDTEVYIDNPTVALYRVGNTHQSYVNDNCVTLPCSYLLENRVDLLESIISDITGKKLSTDEQLYIRQSFNQYRNKQDTLLLADPIAYVKKLKSRAVESKKKFLDINI